VLLLLLLLPILFLLLLGCCCKVWLVLSWHQLPLVRAALHIRLMPEACVCV
jgi:hypothetical protein